MSNNIDIIAINDIAVEAGEKILDIYHNADLSKIVDYKSDNSPLTLADNESHKIIVRKLEELFPEIPWISEEGKNIAYNTRKQWEKFWLIDPLDGTKEFIKKNGEFTVNIALIEQGLPVLGVIYAPDKKWLYFGNQNAYKKVGEEITSITVNNKKEDLTAAQSRSHASDEEAEVLSRYPVTKKIAIGSSLKLCMVAEGKADIYYRHGPTMEWDIAAGHAIVKAAGGELYYDEGNKPFTYNKESLRNGSFLCRGF